jgi:hypothetical protein
MDLALVSIFLIILVVAGIRGWVTFDGVKQYTIGVKLTGPYSDKLLLLLIKLH